MDASSVFIGCLIAASLPHGMRWKRLRSTDPARSKRYLFSWLFWFSAFMALGFLSILLHVSEGVQTAMAVAMAVVSVITLFFVGEEPG